MEFERDHQPVRAYYLWDGPGAEPKHRAVPMHEQQRLFELGW
jgi:hypothetical protein